MLWRILIASAAGLVIVGLGVLAAGALRDNVESDQLADDESLVGRLAVAVALDLTAAGDGIEDIVTSVAMRGPGAVARAGVRPTVPGATAIAVVDRSEGGSAEVVAGSLDVEPDELMSPAVAGLLDAARDTVAVRMSSPIGPPGARRVLLAASVHTADGQPVDPAPLAVPDRRATTSGWVVASIDPAAVVSRHLESGAVATVAAGSTVIPVSDGDVPGHAPEAPIDVFTRRWTIAATANPGGTGWPSDAVAALVVAFGLAVLVMAALEISGQRRRRAEHQSARRLEQLRLIGEIAPVLQQSLRLDDVLPVVAVQLTDQFGLAGVAISVPGPTGQPMDLFAVGDPPDRSVAPALRPPEQAEPGETVALALDREGRTVALLRLVAGEPLDRPAMDSLWAVSELVTAAIVNTNLYRSQQDTMRRLRDLDEMKTAFLGTASHELRTPATAISGFASMLSSHWDRLGDDQRKEVAGRIAANASALDALVQDLLDFSRLDRGTLRVRLRSEHLPDLVRRVLDRLAPAIGEHRVETDFEEVPLVAVDPNGVERIVTNLLTNAAKFSPPGSTIRVGTQLSPRGAEVVVDDEGPGVPPGDRRLIFTRFYRGSGEHVTSTRGVGIGLSVVKEFVDQMGAGISVTEAPGGGARFIVAFPTSASDAQVTAGPDGDTFTKEGDSAQSS